MIRIALVLGLLAAPAMATQNAVPGLYAVQGVAANDVLNVRQDPEAGAAIIAELAPDADGIEVVALSGNSRWGRVNAGEQSGWVAMRFLSAYGGQYQGRFPSPASCFGTEPFWTLNISDDALRFDRLDEGVADFTAGNRETAIGRRDQWSARAFRDGRNLTVVVGTEACNDGMSDRAYGLRATVLISTDTSHDHYAGCCSLAP
ncbi:COG3650 family protein [Palleronia sp. THAF1]|uniref:COG3650 family protein n=1 Tax=Palleronia sp. THAF1 TaxID=2587842 RepID=UPI001267A2B5|nr:peptide-binding protein [Palleronia sp. THAF1]